MKVVILSDIHGNADALEATLQAIPQDISEFWILGDLVGYYYQINKVLSLLKPLPCKFIAGNHEHYLKSGIHDPAVLSRYKSQYGSSLEIALGELNNEDLNFLTSLPDQLAFSLGNKEILLCHGSPWDNDEYIYPDVLQKKLEKYDELSASVIFQGHTHYPMELTHNNKKIINPGSLGQPRNRQAGAHWAIYDSETNEVTFKTTLYSIESLIKEIETHDPTNVYLKTVLTRK